MARLLSKDKDKDKARRGKARHEKTGQVTIFNGPCTIVRLDLLVEISLSDNSLRFENDFDLRCLQFHCQVFRLF